MCNHCEKTEKAAEREMKLLETDRDRGRAAHMETIDRMGAERDRAEEREAKLETALSRLLDELGRLYPAIAAAHVWNEWRAATDNRPREGIEATLFDAIAGLSPKP